MPDLEAQILAAVAKKNYRPLKPKVLPRKLNVPSNRYAEFRRSLRSLLSQQRLEVGKNHTIRAVQPHGTVTGIYRATSAGFGFVRPHPVEGNAGPEIHIRAGKALDAATGDE